MHQQKIVRKNSIKFLKESNAHINVNPCRRGGGGLIFLSGKNLSLG